MANKKVYRIGFNGRTVLVSIPKGTTSLAFKLEGSNYGPLRFGNNRSSKPRPFGKPDPDAVIPDKKGQAEWVELRHAKGLAKVFGLPLETF
jgi:hypothetical protein